MKNDIEWLKGQILILQEKYTTKRDISGPGNRRYYNGMLSSIGLILDFINELGKPEVLSQEWIEKHTWNNHYIKKPFVYVKDLQNLLVPKQELPVIPKWVADSIESKKRVGTRLNVAMSEFPEIKLEKELGIDENECNELYARAWLDGYEVEEEPLYFALIKGHELMADEGDWTCNYWNLSILDGRVFPSDRFSRHDNYLTSMSKSEWSKIGINDTNADFVNVEEIEE